MPGVHCFPRCLSLPSQQKSAWTLWVPCEPRHAVLHNVDHLWDVTIHLAKGSAAVATVVDIAPVSLNSLPMSSRSSKLLMLGRTKMQRQ